MLFSLLFYYFLFEAELEEVVGTEAIDGWDLDANEKITDEDLMEVDADASEAEKPKVSI